MLLALFFYVETALSRVTYADTKFKFVYQNIVFEYDISPIQITDDMFEDYYTTTKYIYNFNVAGSVLPYGDNQVCEPTKTIGCQQVPETNLYYGLGKVDTQNVTLINPNPEGSGPGLQITYSGGTYCPGYNVYRKSVYLIYCKPHYTDLTPFGLKVYEHEICTYTYYMYSRAGCYTNSYPLLPTKSESVVEIKTQGAPINVPTHDAEMMSKVTIKPSPVSNSIISVQTISIGAIVLIFLMVFSGLLIYVFKKTIKERLYEYGVLSTGKNYQNTEPENVTLRNADLQSDEFVNQTSV